MHKEKNNDKGNDMGHDRNTVTVGDGKTNQSIIVKQNGEPQGPRLTSKHTKYWSEGGI